MSATQLVISYNIRTLYRGFPVFVVFLAIAFLLPDQVKNQSFGDYAQASCRKLLTALYGRWKEVDMSVERVEQD